MSHFVLTALGIVGYNSPMKLVDGKHNHRGRHRAEQTDGEASLPAPERQPANETALRETAGMMNGVGARIKELSATLTTLGSRCAETAQAT